MADPVIRHGWHWSFGWLRRPELDEDGAFCYEEPEGDLIFVKRTEYKSQMYLDCRMDEFSGELYTCLARLPRRSAYNRRTN